MEKLSHMQMTQRCTGLCSEIVKCTGIYLLIAVVYVTPVGHFPLAVFTYHKVSRSIIIRRTDCHLARDALDHFSFYPTNAAHNSTSSYFEQVIGTAVVGSRVCARTGLRRSAADVLVGDVRSHVKACQKLRNE